MSNKFEIDLSTQNGVELGLQNIIETNKKLLYNDANTERLINAGAFYISTSKNLDLTKMSKENKMIMLYGVLKEAMVNGEAGLDYDIIPFKGKPTIMRKKEGWYKIIDMIIPADMVRFSSGVFNNADGVRFNPVTEEISKIPEDAKSVTKADDIGLSFAHIELANGFKKTVTLSREDMLTIKKASPSGNGDYSPWNAWTKKMCNTKVQKELAKELYTIYGNRLASHLRQAIISDDLPVLSVDKKGNIINDNSIYDNKPLISDNETVNAFNKHQSIKNSMPEIDM